MPLLPQDYIQVAFRVLKYAFGLEEEGNGGEAAGLSEISWILFLHLWLLCDPYCTSVWQAIKT